RHEPDPRTPSPPHGPDDGRTTRGATPPRPSRVAGQPAGRPSGSVGGDVDVVEVVDVVVVVVVDVVVVLDVVVDVGDVVQVTEVVVVVTGGASSRVAKARSSRATLPRACGVSGRAVPSAKGTTRPSDAAQSNA